VIQVSAAIENDSADAGRQGALGNRLSDFLRSFDIAAGFQAHPFFGG
jgi:hypothetical protein